MKQESDCIFPGRAIPDPITLYATSEDSRIRDSLRRLLQGERLEVTEAYPDVLRVTCTAGQLAQMGAEVVALFRPPELELIRCRLVPGDTVPSLAQLMHTQTLGGLVAWVDGLWLESLLAAERLVTYFQPIVPNQRPSEVFAYECLLRGKLEDGRLILPDRLFAAARATGMLQALDQVARLVAVESASKLQLSTCIFINFNPRFIENPSRDLRRTIQAAQQSGIPAERFVFEVVESDEIVDFDRLRQALDYCRQAGCRVALDDLGAGYSSLYLMALVKPDYVKLDMKLIRDVHKDMYKSCVAGKLIELARQLGVATIVEGVETYGEWVWATKHGADYSQGFLFAYPEAVPPLPRDPSQPGHVSRDDSGRTQHDTSVLTASNVV